MKLKAISVKDPFASEILSGTKKQEFRSWTTKHRGPILICVSKNPKTKNSGKAIGIVDLVSVTRGRGFSHGKFSWELSNPRGIDPFEVKGKLRLFEVEMKGGVTNGE